MLPSRESAIAREEPRRYLMLVIAGISAHDDVVTRNLDIGLLRTFAAVADHRSMTAASRVLHLTQGAVSQQIARLETMTGGPLLARDRRGVRLTPSGERLLGKARRLLALNDEIWTDLRGGTVGGSVRLGLPYDLVGPCFTPVLKAYAEAYPHVELSLTCGSSTDLAQALAEGRFDLAVLEEPVGPSSAGECLAVDRLVWAGARGGTAHARNPLPISMVAQTCAFRPVVLAALQRQNRAWRTVYESGSLDATLATVRMDLAVSAWLVSTVPADLAILPPETGLPDLSSFAITLHVPDRPPTPAAGELARYIRDGLTRPRPIA